MKLNPPSLQHVARVYRPTAGGVKREFLKLAAAHPPFSYSELYELLFDMVRLGKTYDEVRAAISTRISLKLKRDSFLRVLPIATRFFKQLSPEYIMQVQPRSYSIGRELRVPFAPPMICGVRGDSLIPWMIFWKKNPITQLQLSLFVSIIDEILEQDSDLECSRLLIVDMSEKALQQDGGPKLIDASFVPRLSADARHSMLEIVAEGYLLARMEIAGQTNESQPSEGSRPKPDRHYNQRDFFED